MNDDNLTRFHVHCGTPMQPCYGCGEARRLRCDPYRDAECECGSGPLLLAVATA